MKNVPYVQSMGKSSPIRRLMSVGSLSLSAALPMGVSASPLLGQDLDTFSVLAATTVTNVGPSTIGGNVGVWQSGGANAITGFNSSPGVAVSDPQVAGKVHAGTTTGTPNAMQAQLELTTARNGLSSLGAGTVLASADLQGLTLSPGVYTVPEGSTNLSGLLRLDGGGNANAAWVFQMQSTLITSSASSVEVFNTGGGAGVYWNVASSATLDTGTSFMGNVLAQSSITMNTGATNLCGRALADTGAVTLQMNSLSSGCTGALSGSRGLNGGLDVTDGVVRVLAGSPVSAVPEPASWALFGLGLSFLGLKRRRPSAGLSPAR